MNVEKKTSDEWYPIVYPNKEVVIMVPDGWDRCNFKYSYYKELITQDEFKKRVMSSTFIFKNNKFGGLE